ncbi:olfactory receptor 56A4-like [Pleurodeles waltl]|uniref:olfactory receptor 56A4-like n=1 Tax=Pleurodeles waltl TaxID=8319 RepID=UPI003709879D
MLASNITSSFQIPHFVLICFPSIQDWQHWLSIPLVLLLLLAVVANFTILTVIRRENSLHEPMYYLLSILAVIDLVLCLTTIPKMLGILCFNMKIMNLPSCFLQMYIMNSFIAMESCTFLVMAYDRYTAICNPLMYPCVINNGFVLKAFVFIILRNSTLLLPVPVLAARLQYCSRNVVGHCFCTSAATTALACGDRTISAIYQLAIGFGLLGSDLILISLSYCMILRVVLKIQTEGAIVKAFSTCTSHVILILFFYTVLLVLIFTTKLENVILPDIPIFLNSLHFLVPPVLNPVVYGVRTKEIKQGIKKMIRNRNINS